VRHRFGSGDLQGLSGLLFFEWNQKQIDCSPLCFKQIDSFRNSENTQPLMRLPNLFQNKIGRFRSSENTKPLMRLPDLFQNKIGSFRNYEETAISKYLF